jgi:hypothetical protein
VAGAAAATVARGAKAETATDRAKTGGYRETEHVRTYYDLAKF